ncbi:IQ and AAA domain-containing protein 1, partial [Acanthisitta chloris]
FSTSTYNTMWAVAQKELDILLQTESQEFLQPQKDCTKVFKMLATAYIKYVQSFRNLETAHDQLIHQQKRALIQQVLDGVIGRILEIKKEMVRLENSECQYMDDILMDLKLLPEDLEIPIPRYFIKENLEVLRQREKALDEILLDAGLQEEKHVKAMTVEEAVRVIQTAERARQGRCRAAFMKQIYLKDKMQTKPEGQMGPSPDDAAIFIQKVWRGYIQRKETEKMREEEMILLGMSRPPGSEAVSSLQMHAGKANALQSEVQETWEKVSFKEKPNEAERLSIRNKLQDQIGQWCLECRHIRGKFPDYPMEKAGGSKAILSEKTPEQVVEELAAKKEMEKQDQKGKNEKEEKEKLKEKKPQKTGKKEEDEGWKMAPSNFLSILEEGSKQYKAVWQNRDEGLDFLQDHDPELIKEEMREEVEEEIRVQVDELMEQKLENLRLAVDGEISGNQKQGGKSKKNSEKPHQRNRKRGHRNPMMSLAHRSIDSLYKELAEEGLLIKAQAVHLSSYIGKYGCVRTILPRTGQPVPSLADVRQLTALYGILPLGSQMVHKMAPLVKSMLFTGPAGVGKKMLVHAICTETGANLFNLSPSNIAGKFPDKDALQMMFHMVLKVAKQLQPSVVWIGETEKAFSKAVPKAEEEMSSKHLGKMLPHFLKAVRATDRVLLVGTTTRPFDASLKRLCQVYQKIILIPRPDYLSRFGKYFSQALWKHFILHNGGAITNLLNINCLAQVSDGFTPGHIVEVVQTVLSKLRLLQMCRKPLRTVEFVTSLARHKPVYNEEETFQVTFS